MEKRLFTKKILSGVLIGSMMLSMGGSVFAKELESQGTAATDGIAGKRTKTMQKVKLGFEFKGQKDLLVKDRAPGKGLETVLDKLVEEGKLSQGKADEVKKYLKEKAEDKKAEFEKLKTMTKEERQSYFEENKGIKRERINLMDQLVKDGIITEAQGEQIEAKMKEMMPQVKGKRGHEKGMTVPLDKLVEEGKLTQEKAEAVKKYFEKKAEDQKAQFEQMKNMTKEERQKYFEENKKERTNIFDQLVKDGVLTKEEVENLKILKTRSFKEKNNA